MLNVNSTGQNLKYVMEALFHSFRAIVFICDGQREIRDVNKACRKYLSIGRKALIGRSIYDCVIDEDRDKLGQLIQTTGQEDTFWEINFLTGTGEPVLFSCYCVDVEGMHAIVARKGEPSMLLLQEELMVINNEMTNLYRELEQKNKQLARMNLILEKQRNEIQLKNTLLGNQLRLARRIQQHLINKDDFQLYDLDFRFNYLPADDIGGDYFNVVDLKNGKVGVFISDVSGHGISAALITMIIKMIFLKQQEEYENPERLMYRMNKEFCSIFGDGFEDVYCTAFYCVIDTKSMSICYCNAGHPQPISAERDTEKEMDGFNIPIGFFKDTQYTPGRIEYSEKDRFMFLTDGLSDIMLKYDIKSVDYGQFFERLKEQGLLEIAADSGSFRDDVSLILVEVKKKEDEKSAERKEET